KSMATYAGLENSDWAALEEGRNRRHLSGHPGLFRSPEHHGGTQEVGRGKRALSASKGRTGGGRTDPPRIHTGAGRREALVPGRAEPAKLYRADLQFHDIIHFH